jgi:hypothetical protein
MYRSQPPARLGGPKHGASKSSSGLSRDLVTVWCPLRVESVVINQVRQLPLTVRSGI